MGTLRRCVPLALLIPVLGACGAEQGEPEAAAAPAAAYAASPDEADAAQTAIEKLRSDWVAAAERKDAAAVAAMYEDGAVVASPASGVRRGRPAIQGWLQEAFAVASGLRVNSTQLVVGGELAYDQGEYSQQITPPGAAAVTDSGSYLVVLRRQADGGWKIAQHFSVGPPAPPPARP